MRNIDAAAVEAAGTWFGALVSLGAVVTAARVFLSDKLFQDYQLAADREREREEQAERDRSLLAKARVVDLHLSISGPSFDAYRDWHYLAIDFKIEKQFGAQDHALCPAGLTGDTAFFAAPLEARSG